MKVISTKLDDVQYLHLDILAFKLRTSGAAILRAWIEQGLKENPISEQDAAMYERFQAESLPGLEVPTNALRLGAPSNADQSSDIKSDEITNRLERLGFALVDDVRGLEGDLKWRSRKLGVKGSLWVKDNAVHATGVYERLFGPGLSDAHRPKGCQCRYPVWTGRPEIEALLAKIASNLGVKSKG